MPIWKQCLVTLVLMIVAGLAWARFVPSAPAVLERAGLAAPLDRLGLLGKAEAPAEGPGPARARGGAVVVARAPGQATMNDRITSIGTARGIRTVTLASEVTGTVAAVHVRSGQQVAAGAVLVELDHDAAQIALDRAVLLVADAQADFDRATRLRASGAVNEVSLKEAELALRTAELGRREADHALAQQFIRAPFAGWVGILDLEPGDLLASGTEITRLEDRSRLLVDFRVPERVVARLVPGAQLEAVPLAAPEMVLKGEVVALDNRLEAASRSLRVQAAIDNAMDRLRAGMAIQVTMHFPGESFPSVDPLAIQWSGEGAFVWVVRAGHAVRVPVRILQRNSDSVLVAATFSPGDQVVSEGVQVLREGATVTLAGA